MDGYLKIGFRGLQAIEEKMVELGKPEGINTNDRFFAAPSSPRMEGGGMEPREEWLARSGNFCRYGNRGAVPEPLEAQAQ